MKFFVCKAYSSNTLSLCFFCCCCCFFLYRLVTSIETCMALLGSLILLMKLIKSVVRWSTNAEIRSVGPEHPDIIGLPTGVEWGILVSV